MESGSWAGNPQHSCPWSPTCNDESGRNYFTYCTALWPVGFHQNPPYFPVPRIKTFHSCELAGMGWERHWADFGSVCHPLLLVGKLSQDSLWPSLGAPGGAPRWKACTRMRISAPPISGKPLKSCFNLLNGLPSFQQCLPWVSKCWCATCVSHPVSAWIQESL